MGFVTDGVLFFCVQSTDFVKASGSSGHLQVVRKGRRPELSMGKLIEAPGKIARLAELLITKNPELIRDSELNLDA